MMGVDRRYSSIHAAQVLVSNAWWRFIVSMQEASSIFNFESTLKS